MAYQAILRVYKGFSGGGWPRAWRGVRVADMGGRTTPLRSPYKPGQVPHSAHTRLKSQQAAFPLGEEVRISRLGLKPAPRSEKADIGSTENSTDIRRIKTSWLRPRAHAPSTCASSAEKSAPLAHSPMYFFYRNYWFQTKNALSDFLGAQGFRTALPGHKSIGAVGGRYLVVHFSAIPPLNGPGSPPAWQFRVESLVPVGGSSSAGESCSTQWQSESRARGS